MGIPDLCPSGCDWECEHRSAPGYDGQIEDGQPSGGSPATARPRGWPAFRGSVSRSGAVGPASGASAARA